MVRSTHRLSSGLAIAGSLSALICQSSQSWGDAQDSISVIVSEIAKVSSRTELAVFSSALTLQQMLATESWSEQGKSLSQFDLTDPTILEATTNRGYQFIAVIFRSKNLDDVEKAFEVFQVCSNVIMLPAIGGFGLFGDAHIEAFISVSKDSSADYFEKDLCAAIFSGDHH